MTINVGDLINYLKTYPHDTPVAYRCYSESMALELKDIDIQKLCKERPDGWVANARPDKELIDWLVFPGN